MSDAVLAQAVGCDTKWLYNAARRTKRKIERTVANAVWWRLVHHLADGVGAPIAAAVRGADALSALSPDAGRVKLSATTDDTVAISVDLSRFHDGAALAVAAAIHTAVPKRRGRPKKRIRPVDDIASASTLVSAEDATMRLRTVLSAVPAQPTDGMGYATERPAEALLALLADGGVEFVVTGGLAAAYHGVRLRRPAPGGNHIDLVVALEGNRAMSLAGLLNKIGARPRGVASREAFTLDSALIRANALLALRVGGLSLNLSGSVPRIGEFPQVRDGADAVSLDGRTCLVLGIEALSQSLR